MTKQLTDNEIKELVLAQIEYKKAKEKTTRSNISSYSEL